MDSNVTQKVFLFVNLLFDKITHKK
jgi:hypothetical protein